MNRMHTYRDHRDDGCAQPAALLLAAITVLALTLTRAARNRGW